MTHPDLAAIIERHVRTVLAPDEYCMWCGRPWPCDAFRLLALLRETREALQSLRATTTHGGLYLTEGNRERLLAIIDPALAALSEP